MMTTDLMTYLTTPDLWSPSLWKLVVCVVGLVTVTGLFLWMDE